MHHFPNNNDNQCTWNVRYNSKWTRLLCRENRQIVINDIPIGDARSASKSSAVVKPVDGEVAASATGRVRLTTRAAQVANGHFYFDGPPRTSANRFAGNDDELVAATGTGGKVYIWSVPNGCGERTIN